MKHPQHPEAGQEYQCPASPTGRHRFTWSGDYWGYCDHCGKAPTAEQVRRLEESNP